MRQIFKLDATQVITSESHPEGLYSPVSGFPKTFDSGEGGDIEQTLKNAKAAYFAQLSTNYGNTNPNRVMTTVTLEQTDGRQIMRECIGGFPDMTPPEPTPEPEEELVGMPEE